MLSTAQHNTTQARREVRQSSKVQRTTKRAVKNEKKREGGQQKIRKKTEAVIPAGMGQRTYTLEAMLRIVYKQFKQAVGEAEESDAHEKKTKREGRESNHTDADTDTDTDTQKRTSLRSTPARA